MRSIYKQSISLIFLIGVCMGSQSFAQTPVTDTSLVTNKRDYPVNVAYGKQPEWLVTGAITTVGGSDLKTHFTSDFTSKLSGRIPGLIVQQSAAEPGFESYALSSRGYNTFGVAGRNMLILIDGFEGNYTDIVPDEIETVSLLKDASATAMYGSRAANGVLLITTKRGEEGKLKVNFSAQHGLQYPFRLPKFLGSYDYATLYNEALANEGQPARYTQEELDKYKTGSDPYLYPDVDWYKEILRKSTPLSNYDLNFTGGNSSIKYFVLLNHVSNQSIYRKTGDESDYSINGIFKRVNLRSNLDIKLSKRLSAFATLGGVVTDQANPASNNTNSIFNSMQVIAPNAFPVFNPNGTVGRSTNYSSPLGDILYKGFYTSNARTLQTSIGFTELLDMLAPGLSISAKISFNSYFISNSNKSRTYESYVYNPDQTYTKYGLNTSLVGNELASGQYRNLAYQALLNYDRSFGLNDVSAVAVFNEDEYTISGDNFPTKHTNISGRGTYVYNKKYIGEISGSYMGSANFPKDKRFGLFPAVSFGWIASNENFLAKNSIITFLKLKGSYGMVGNDNIGGTAFMFEQYYPYYYQYYFGTSNSSASSIVQGSPANHDVTWEKEKVLNVGFETTLFNHLDIAFEVFNRNRYDILVQPNSTDPDFMGYTKPYLNLGKANNKGIEGKLRYYTDPSKDFSFFAEANVWYYKNEVVYNAEAVQLYPYQYRSGHPIDQPFGLVALGLFNGNDEIAASPKQIWAPVKPGDVKYQNQNDDNVIDQNDIRAIGNPDLPNLSGSLHMGAKYKGFDLDLFFQGVANRSVNFNGYPFQALQNKGKIGEIALGRWTPETASSATYPRLTLDNENNYRYSTYWLRNGSFLKLRSVELGYTLPARLTNVARIAEARIFVNGTNLFSLDHMDGYRDPEVGSGYPLMRTYSLGIKVQFK